jgi:hypothetical protein
MFLNQGLKIQWYASCQLLLTATVEIMFKMHMMRILLNNLAGRIIRSAAIFVALSTYLLWINLIESIYALPHFSVHR